MPIAFLLFIQFQFIWLSVVFAASAILNLVYPNNDPLSVCQDGSPSVYYFLPFTNASFNNTWLFHLQGGGQCYSEESCANRATTQGPTFTTSLNYGPTNSQHGIFDDDPVNSPLFGANKVYVPYCSSDAWIGDSAPNELTWYNHFRGQRIIRSALNDIINKGYLQPNCNIIFSGGSKGAEGIMNNIQNLLPLLPNGCQARAFLDSPFNIDFPVYNASHSLMEESKEIYARYNVSSVLLDSCLLKYPGDQSWKCIYGQYRMQFLDIQYVMVSSKFDKFQLNFDIGFDPINGTYQDLEALNYAYSWSQTMTIELTQLIQSSVINKKNNWILSWACYNHDVCPNSAFSLTSVRNVTEYFAVESLINGEINAPALFIDQCDGFACGSGC